MSSPQIPGNEFISIVLTFIGSLVTAVLGYLVMKEKIKLVGRRQKQTQKEEDEDLVKSSPIFHYYERDIGEARVDIKELGRRVDDMDRKIWGIISELATLTLKLEYQGKDIEELKRRPRGKGAV